MKYFYSIIFSVAILCACNSGSTKNQGAENLSAVEISIEGMSCEKMCGGAIQKSLEKLEGVASTELDFDAENPVDKVTVKFDSKKVSEKEMKAKVEELANGAYKVTGVSEVGS